MPVPADWLLQGPGRSQSGQGQATGPDRPAAGGSQITAGQTAPIQPFFEKIFGLYLQQNCENYE